jgi:uncharacterized protein (DUF2132 family)
MYLIRKRFIITLEISIMDKQSNDPLHGITLEKILIELVDYFGWEDLGQHIPINCFISNPSIQSSLKFLRKTPWARKKVENLYVRMKR